MKDLDELDETATRFLLGEMADDERAAFEERLITDETLFDQVKAVEQDLCDTYVQGGLAPERRRRVEEHLLVAKKGPARLAVADRLAAKAPVIALARRPRRTPLLLAVSAL